MFFSVGIVQIFMVARYFIWKTKIQIVELQYIGYGQYHEINLGYYCPICLVVWTLGYAFQNDALK